MISYVIISSCIFITERPKNGHFNFKDRLLQTYKTISTIRQKIKDSYIILADTSDISLSIIDKKITKMVDKFIDLGGRRDILTNNKHNQFKSLNEYILMAESLEYIKTLPLTSEDIIFKHNGRYILNNEFNIENFLVYDKFIFKKIKVIPSEFNRFRYGTHLCTLLYSFSFSMVDKYLFFLRSDSLFEKTTVGTEHAHFNYYKEHPEDFFFIKTLGIEGRSYIDMPMKE